jgi:hypothetical protein
MISTVREWLHRVELRTFANLVRSRRSRTFPPRPGALRFDPFRSFGPAHVSCRCPDFPQLELYATTGLVSCGLIQPTIRNYVAD